MSSLSRSSLGMRSLSRDEKMLYHQIHPLKLLTDWGTAPIAYYLLWRHRLLAALLVMFGPPILVSWALVRWANLEPLAASSGGSYIKQYMTPAMQAMRFGGNGLISVGAWFHQTWLLPAGLAVILFGWFRGKLMTHR